MFLLVLPSTKTNTNMVQKTLRHVRTNSKYMHFVCSQCRTKKKTNDGINKTEYQVNYPNPFAFPDWLKNTVNVFYDVNPYQHFFPLWHIGLTLTNQISQDRRKEQKTFNVISPLQKIICKNDRGLISRIIRERKRRRKNHKDGKR